MTDSYLRIRVRSEAGRGAPALEIALAEAFELGAQGVEEAADGRSALVFVPECKAAALADRLRELAGVRADAPEPLPDIAWSDAWKEGLGAIVISPRLCVRPPFAPAPEGFDGAEIVIDPAQAFGTGHHASTRLALEWMDEARDRLVGARVLDVGCGSGVLAIAARALGARLSVAHDLDPLSGTAAGQAVGAHGMRAHVHVFTGTTAALASTAGFDGIVANMIRSELEPLLEDFGRLVRPGGWLIASGLLAGERERFTASCARVGFDVARSKGARDGEDEWLAVLAPRRAEAAPD